jgi:chromosome condensin MukBEF MukE localization factor
MMNERDLENAALFAVEFDRCVRAGDDTMNAKLRIIEQGCPVDLAEKIAKEFGDENGDEMNV